MSLSKRVIASYVADWIAILVIAALAGAFSAIEPHYHDFSILNLDISYPLKPDTVPIWVAGVVVGVVPAIIIPIICFIFVPGPSFAKGRSRGELFRLKLWEWHTGWLGLAMSLATALMITQGLKNFGKPRPNMLDRCQPDYQNINKYKVGGYGGDISARWILVSIDACTQTDKALLKDGFQSWPSGHSSASWAGLLYFTLFLCSKFAVVLPYVPASLYLGNTAAQAMYKRSDSRDLIRHRDEAAAPPVYTLFFILVPIGGALYICLSRWMDYMHHGFDIISGSVIGIVCAYVSFRWYHLPISQGSGWSWGPRSPDRAFGVGIGRHGYVDEDTILNNRQEQQQQQYQQYQGHQVVQGNDVEMGLMNSRTSHQQDK